MSCSPFHVPLDEVICQIDECYLEFYNAQGDLIESYPLCGAMIKNFGDTFQLRTEKGTLNMSIEQLQTLGKTIIELNTAVKECKNPPVTIDDIQVENIDVAKFGTSTVQYCEKSTGNICQITKCVLEDGSGNISVQYQPEGDNQWYSLSTLLISYDPLKKSSVETTDCILFANEDKKLTTPIEAIEVKDNKSGTTDYYLKSEYLEGNTNNPLNINNYKKMSNHVGAIAPNPVPKNTTGTFGGELRDTSTLQDVLDDALTNPQFVLPDGSQPNGLIKVKIQALGKGQTADGNTVTVPGVTIGPAAAPIATLDPGQSWCIELPLIDNDCDNFAKFCVDLTTEVVSDANGGFVYEVIGAACDTNDDDATVTV